VEEIVELVRSRYAVDAARARHDLDALIANLLADDLVITEERASAAAVATAEAGTAEYTAPVLNKYTEMADLLALDPPMPELSELPAGQQRD
jgi:hypothetical protein